MQHTDRPRTLASAALVAAVLANLLVGGAPVAAAGELTVRQPSAAVAVPGAPASFVIRITNDADHWVRITGHSIDGPDAGLFSVTEAVEGTLYVPQQAEAIDMRFAADDVGHRYATISVAYVPWAQGEGATGPEVTVTADLEGIGSGATTGVSVIAPSINRSKGVQGQAFEGAFRLRNDSPDPVRIEDLMGYADAGSWDPLAASSPDGCLTSPPLEPGASCVVRFLAAGEDIGSFQIGATVIVRSPYKSFHYRFRVEVTENLSWPDRIRPSIPTLDAPRAVKVAFGSSPRITVRQSYRATDNRAVAGYTVNRYVPSTDSWVTVLDQRAPWPDPLAPTERVEIAVKPNERFQFSVAARDKAGNQAREVAYSGEERYVLTDITTKSSSWTKRTARGKAYKDTYLETKRNGILLSVTVTGRSIAVVGIKGPKAGSVRVRVDGRSVATIDLKSSKLRSPSIVGIVPLGSPGKHTVTFATIIPRGRSVALDSLVVRR